MSNDRFLIRNGVQVRNLASHVLAQALRRLPEDWKAPCGTVAVETCVGRPHKGTCYQAAGFEPVGETAGYAWGVKRPKQPQEARPSGQAPEEVRADPKQVWMKGLTQEEEEWKAALRAQPLRVLGQFPLLELDEDAPWSRSEFERSDLPDRHLRERLLTIGEAWEHKPGQSLPDLFPSGALQQGACRFLHNDRVSMEDMLQPHREALPATARQRAAGAGHDHAEPHRAAGLHGGPGAAQGARQQCAGPARACDDGLHRGPATAGSEQSGGVVATAGEAARGGEGKPALVPGPGTGV